MLYGGKVVYIVLVRHDDNTARVLSDRLLDTHNSRHHIGYLRLRNLYFSVLKVLCNVAPRRLICKRADGSRTEDVPLTEELLGVFMYLRLNVAGEIKVYIGGFIAVEAEEGFKGDIVSVLIEPLSAYRTALIVKVKARADRAVGKELGITALRTSVMRGKRVNLGNSRHRCDEGRADRAARANLISKALGIGNELYRYHIKHGKAVVDNRRELLIKTGPYYIGKLVAVPFVRAAPAGLGELLLSTREVGLVSALGDRAYSLAHIGNPLRILDYHLARYLGAEIFELGEHLSRRAKIYGARLVGVGILHSGKENTPVNLVLLVKKVCVRGCTNRLSELLTEVVNLSVYILQLLLVTHLLLLDKEAVVAERLYLKIIVKRGYFLYFVLSPAVYYRLIKLAGLARRADNKSLSVLGKKRLRYSRKALEIVEVARRNELIEVFQSLLISREDYHMVSRQL